LGRELEEEEQEQHIHGPGKTTPCERKGWREKSLLRVRNKMASNQQNAK
jgi:hypothetical protein